jgi:tetratricopeptide (TPR) repeat protein
MLQEARAPVKDTSEIRTDSNTSWGPVNVSGSKHRQPVGTDQSAVGTNTAVQQTRSQQKTVSIYTLRITRPFWMLCITSGLLALGVLGNLWLKSPALFAHTQNHSSLSEKHNVSAGAVSGASNFFSAFIKSNPNSAETYANRAATLASVQPSAALDDYRSALNLDPNASSIRLQFANLLLRQDHNEEALIEATRLLREDPQSTESLKIAGICNIKLARFEDAVPLLESARQSGLKTDAEVCFRLYEVNHKLGHERQAARYLDEAISAEPDNVRYLLDRARLEIDQRSFDLAKKDLDSVNRLAPSSAESRFLSGICEYKQGNLTLALSSWNESLRIGPELPEVYYQRGIAYMRSGRNYEALADMDRYLEVRPEDTDALRRKRTLISRIGSRRASNPGIRAESVESPAQQTNFLTEGYKAMKANNNATAVRIFKSVVEKEPKNVEAHKYLTYACLRLEDWNETSIQFQAWHALQAVPSSEMWFIGAAMMRAAKYSEAAIVFDELVKTNPDDSLAKVQLIKSVSLSGQTDRARSICQNAIDNANDSQEQQLYSNALISLK